MSWYQEAWLVIDEVDRALPANATYEERKAALFKAYPFGERRYHPYKQWLKAQKIYLARFTPRKAPPLGPLFAGDKP